MFSGVSSPGAFGSSWVLTWPALSRAVEARTDGARRAGGGRASERGARHEARGDARAEPRRRGRHRERATRLARVGVCSGGGRIRVSATRFCACRAARVLERLKATSAFFVVFVESLGPTPPPPPSSLAAL